MEPTAAIAILTAGIVAVAGALGLVYRDKSKLEKETLKRETASAKERQEFRDALIAELRSGTGRFVDQIQKIVEEHQEQENEIHEKHQKIVDEMQRDHRRELTLMVDRVSAAHDNDRAHRREEMAHLTNVFEALNRTISNQQRGSGGNRSG